MITYCLY